MRRSITSKSLVLALSAMLLPFQATAAHYQVKNCRSSDGSMVLVQKIYIWEGCKTEQACGGYRYPKFNQMSLNGQPTGVLKGMAVFMECELKGATAGKSCSCDRLAREPAKDCLVTVRGWLGVGFSETCDPRR